MAEKRKGGTADPGSEQEPTSQEAQAKIGGQEAQAPPVKETIRKGRRTAKRTREQAPAGEQGSKGDEVRTEPLSQPGDAPLARIVYDEIADTTSRVDDGGTESGVQWDAEFIQSIRALITSADDSARDMHALRDVISHGYTTAASRSEVAIGTLGVPQEIWPGNAESWSSKKRSTLGAALVLTASGGATRSRGQELLEEEWLRDREPIDPSSQDQTGGIRTLYRDLIRLRQHEGTNTRGLRGQHVNVYHVNDYDKVIAFHRWESGGPGDDVIVVVNAANRGYDSYTIGFPRSGSWRLRFNSDWGGYSPDFGNHFSYDTVATEGAKDGLGYHGNVGIGPYSVIILSQDG